MADKQARQYSGGMKRRLSVAISFMGDPLVVYLDEPSTVSVIACMYDQGLISCCNNTAADSANMCVALLLAAACRV